MDHRIEREIRNALRIEKTNKLIEAACLIALGVVLLLWSGTALTMICKTIAAIIAIIGIVIAVMFLLGGSHVYGNSIGLFGGVVAVVMGMYLFFNPGLLASLVPTIIGMVVLVTGLVDLSGSIRIMRQRSGGTAIALVIAALEVALGIVFIIHPVILEKFLMTIMAVTLIADGIADIWMMFQLGKAEKPMEAVAAVHAGQVEDAEVRPLNEEAPTPEKENRKPFQKNAEETIPQPQGGAEKTAPMEGYTTIPRHQEPVNEVEQDAKEAGAAANQEIFTDGAPKDASGAK